MASRPASRGAGRPLLFCTSTCACDATHEYTHAVEETSAGHRKGWPVVVLPLHDRESNRREREHWLARTPQERMDALERLRQERDGPQPRLARVARVIERKRS